MRPMSEMYIAQIDVTTRCAFQCSGCTRMIGHVPVRDMDLETFKRAVDSLEGFPGMIGVIGGEPLLWPHFEEATEYLVAKTGGRASRRAPANQPIVNLTDFLLSNYGNIGVKRGVFTSLPPNTIQHWEQIVESYPFIGFNTHENAGLHQQFLIAGNELPISKERRLELIKDCWVNKFWSCSITPQGCWPCEVMGTLAHAFEGPGPKQGWSIEKDWWKRPVSEWSEMCKWCDICGAAMDVPRLLATDRREIVSSSNYERLKRMGSRKVARGEVEIFNADCYDESKFKVKKEIDWYLPKTSCDKSDLATRSNPTHNSLKVRNLECVVLCLGKPSLLELTLSRNMQHFDKMFVVSTADDVLSAEITRRHGAQFVTDSGWALGSGLARLDRVDWMMFFEEDVLLPHDFRERLKARIWNPGTLYHMDKLQAPQGNAAQWCDAYAKDLTLIEGLLPARDESAIKTRPHFFHGAAKSLRGVKWGDGSLLDPACSGSADSAFVERWPENKRYKVDFKVVQLAR